MDPTDFEIAVTGGLTKARVSVRGELDLSTSGELTTALAGELGPERDVVLDLSEVEFMDSTGLTVVLRAMREAEEHGWSFGIASTLSGPALRTIRVSGVLPMLPLVED